MIKTGRALFIGGLLLVPCAAFAQDDTFLPDLAPSLSAAVSSLEMQGFLYSAEAVDLDADGTPEVLVRLTTSVDPEHPELLEWRVLDEQGGSAVQLGSWLGEDVRAVTAQVRGQEDQMSSAEVIYSDASYWFLYRNKMRPYGDMAYGLTNRIHSGGVEDVGAFRDFGLGEVPGRYMARLEFDFSERPGREVMISLMGDGFSRDSDGATPYVLKDARGEIIHQGMSFMHPHIFPLPGGGFQVIETVNWGYQLIRFPEEAGQ